MAHFWLQNDAREWTVQPLVDAEHNLKSFLDEARGHTPATGSAPVDVQFLKVKAGNQENWVLVAGQGSDISINGLPLFLGIRILGDRDEIRWNPNGFLFFSTEELAAVVHLPQIDRKISCPRCKQEIEPGTPAVLCPSCKIYYHQSEQLPCYTYSKNCATCDRETRLGSEYEWIPEEM